MRKAVVAVCAGIMVIAGCENVSGLFGDKDNGRPQRAPKGGVESIVISESAPMYASASSAARQVATLSLGETVYWTQDSTMDDQGDTTIFLQTVLSDGTTGWVPSRALIRNAQAAAVKQETRVYRRPDTLTLTDVRMPFMGMVAITDRTDGWMQVIGEGRDARGWIRQDVITEEKEEVATAIYTRQKIVQGRQENRSALLEDIIFNAPYADSYFIEQLRHMRSLEKLFIVDNDSVTQDNQTSDSDWFSSPQRQDTADTGQKD
ncbi:MAG: hypothetical protein ACOCW2_03190 [Chitinivibrionales bacterium]